MDAHENDPKILRFLPPVTCLAKLQHTQRLTREGANDVQEMQQHEQNRGLDSDSSK
jgi:hypothetical protein